MENNNYIIYILLGITISLIIFFKNNESDDDTNSIDSIIKNINDLENKKINISSNIIENIEQKNELNNQLYDLYQIFLNDYLNLSLGLSFILAPLIIYMILPSINSYFFYNKSNYYYNFEITSKDNPEVIKLKKYANKRFPEISKELKNPIEMEDIKKVENLFKDLNKNPHKIEPGVFYEDLCYERQIDNILHGNITYPVKPFVKYPQYSPVELQKMKERDLQSSFKGQPVMIERLRQPGFLQYYYEHYYEHYEKLEAEKNALKKQNKINKEIERKKNLTNKQLILEAVQAFREKVNKRLNDEWLASLIPQAEEEARIAAEEAQELHNDYLEREENYRKKATEIIDNLYKEGELTPFNRNYKIMLEMNKFREIDEAIEAEEYQKFLEEEEDKEAEYFAEDAAHHAEMIDQSLAVEAKNSLSNYNAAEETVKLAEIKLAEISAKIQNNIQQEINLNEIDLLYKEQQFDQDVVIEAKRLALKDKKFYLIAQEEADKFEILKLQENFDAEGYLRALQEKRGIEYRTIGITNRDCNFKEEDFEEYKLRKAREDFIRYAEIDISDEEKADYKFAQQLQKDLNAADSDEEKADYKFAQQLQKDLNAVDSDEEKADYKFAQQLQKDLNTADSDEEKAD